MKKPSIYYTYLLIDPRNNEVFYVGKGVRDRMNRHFHKSRLAEQTNPKLRRKILKIISLGLLPLASKIFEHEDEWPCHANEMAAVDFYGRDNLCNLTNGGEGISGFKRPEEFKRYMSDIQSGDKGFWFGKKQSTESNEKRAVALRAENNHNFGKPVPIEVREKISSKLKGIPLPPERLEKMMTGVRGVPKSPEHRAKLSAGKTGEKNPMFGKVVSVETRAKRSASLMGKTVGRKVSSETRARISASISGEKNPWFGKKQPPDMVRKRVLSTALTNSKKL